MGVAWPSFFLLPGGHPGPGGDLGYRLCARKIAKEKEGARALLTARSYCTPSPDGSPVQTTRRLSKKGSDVG